MNQLKIAPARSQFSILRQICSFIPQHWFLKLRGPPGRRISRARSALGAMWWAWAMRNWPNTRVC